MSTCTGTSKRTGKPCTRPSMPNGTCYHHGGATPAGIACVNLKTGRYSKRLPERLASRYHEALADAELLALREDVALVDARIADLLSRVDSGETGSFYGEVQKAWSAYTEPKTVIEQEAARQRMNGLLGAALTDFQAWAELGAQIDRRQKLVESERKRLIEMKQVITVESLMVQVAAFKDVIRRHVTDPISLAGIQRDLQALTD